MTATVSSKGQIVLPANRQQEGNEQGQEFEIERIDSGVYLLKRKTRRRNEGLVNLLLACPVKDWFQPYTALIRQRYRQTQARITHLVDANVLCKPTRARPDSKGVVWLTVHEGEFVVDSIVLGELWFGVLALPNGRKRAELKECFNAVVIAIECLPWDAAVSLRWARLIVELKKKRTPPGFDTFEAQALV